MPAQPTPRQNHLLAALCQQEYQRLVPDLEPCPLPLGWPIPDAGDRERYLDRLRTNEMTLTQELIADMLGVRREGVTEAAGRLQKGGFIHCSRGRIVVLDRPQLETRVCECYAAIKREYDGLHADYRQADVASSAGPVTRVHAFSQPNAARV